MFCTHVFLSLLLVQHRNAFQAETKNGNARLLTLMYHSIMHLYSSACIEVKIRASYTHNNTVIHTPIQSHEHTPMHIVFISIHSYKCHASKYFSLNQSFMNWFPIKLFQVDHFKIQYRHTNEIPTCFMILCKLIFLYLLKSFTYFWSSQHIWYQMIIASSFLPLSKCIKIQYR